MQIELTCLHRRAFRSQNFDDTLTGLIAVWNELCLYDHLTFGQSFRSGNSDGGNVKIRVAKNGLLILDVE